LQVRVVLLHRGEAGTAVGPRDLPCPLDLPDGVVGAADAADRTRGHEFVEGDDRLFQRCGRIGLVGPVQVDVVRTQSSQTALDPAP
jgi:hypothetical protein